MANIFGWISLLVLVSLLTQPYPAGSARDQSSSKSQPRGSVLCEDGLAYCPVHSSTCCLGKTNRYFCCPLPNAVCCSDGIHCCPQCFSCNVKGNSCLRPAADAAAVRIYALVPHIDKRIHTTPPIPPAIAAVAAVAKQREIAENRAAALAAAIARKKAAEESEGFVSGVLSAVKLTLFSNGDAAKKPPTKVSPGVISQDSKSYLNVPHASQPQLKRPQNFPTTNTAPQIRPQTARISKSPGIMAHAASNIAQGGKSQQKISPQATPTSSKPVQKPNLGDGRGGVKKIQTKTSQQASVAQEKEEQAQNSGFFSSVFSVVTDFYSGGSKEDVKPTDVKKPTVSGGQHHTQQQKQQQQQVKQQTQQNQRQQQQRPVQPHGKVLPQTAGKSPQSISKQLPLQQQKTLAQKQPVRTSAPNQQLNKPVVQSQKISQVNFKQGNVQGKSQGQGGVKQASASQQQNTRQGVGISQKSATVLAATQQKKAKAWEAKRL